MTEREPYPERQPRDHGRAVVQAAIAGMPAPTWLTGFGLELLTHYLPSSLEKRRDRWFRTINELLIDVERTVLDDEAFQSRVLQASQAALGTQFEEKLVLLANGLRSCAETATLGGDTFMDKRLLEWVDQLEPIHFQILSAIRNDHGWGGNVPWSTVLSSVQIEDDDIWYEALEDLTSLRLAGATGYNSERPLDDASSELIWVMKRGRQLVDFVRMMTNEEFDDNGLDSLATPG